MDKEHREITTQRALNNKDGRRLWNKSRGKEQNRSMSCVISRGTDENTRDGVFFNLGSGCWLFLSPHDWLKPAVAEEITHWTFCAHCQLLPVTNITNYCICYFPRDFEVVFHKMERNFFHFTPTRRQMPCSFTSFSLNIFLIYIINIILGKGVTLQNTYFEHNLTGGVECAAILCSVQDPAELYDATR